MNQLMKSRKRTKQDSLIVIKSWIKKPENVVYVLMIIACIAIVGVKHIGAIILTLLIMALLGFLIKKLFFKD
jgi:hypothetical protein